MDEEALKLVERVHREGGDAAAALREVWERFRDKSLAARAARHYYSPSQIGGALLELWPSSAPYYYYYDLMW